MVGNRRRLGVFVLILVCFGCRGRTGATADVPITSEAALEQESFDGEHERDVRSALDSLFGPSSKPFFRVLPEWEQDGFDPNAPGAWLDESAREALSEDRLDGDYPSLAESAQTYRQTCLNCHGHDGAGNGPTAAFLDPPPRDYRSGEFKFSSLLRPAPPARGDLVRVVQRGITGTAMPAFDTFSADRLQGLVDYVLYLSMRGETELLLNDDWDIDDRLPKDVVEGDYRLVLERWRSDNTDYAIPVAPLPAWSRERVEHGRLLFTAPRGANCIRCHGEDARGHGSAAFSQGDGSEARPLLRDDWGNPIRPRDLTTGIFRFGSTPEDNYRRIYAGIRGTPMPGHFGMWIEVPEGAAARRLSEDDIWSLVFFVRSLSSPASQ